MTAFAQRMGKHPKDRSEYKNVNVEQSNSHESSNFILSFKPNKNQQGVDSNSRIATFNGDNLFASKDTGQSPPERDSRMSNFYSS